MPFKNRLRQLLDEISGSIGAIIVDWEGEAVDQTGCISDYDIKVIGAHNGIILTRIQAMLERVKGGDLQEVVIRSGETADPGIAIDRRLSAAAGT